MSDMSEWFSVAEVPVGWEARWTCKDQAGWDSCYAKVWESKPDVCDAGHEQPRICGWCDNEATDKLSTGKYEPMVVDSFGSNHFCTDCLDEAREILLDIVLSMPLEARG
jgi:hypothetical protein